MGGVDHQGAIKRCFICQLNENFIENTEPAPPDKAIVQRFVGAVLIRCIFPLKSVLDDVDDAADDTPVIHTGSTVRTGKERFDTLQLGFRKDKIGYAWDTSVPPAYPVFLPLKITSPAPSFQGGNLFVPDMGEKLVLQPGKDFLLVAFRPCRVLLAEPVTGHGLKGQGRCLLFNGGLNLPPLFSAAGSMPAASCFLASSWRARASFSPTAG